MNCDHCGQRLPTRLNRAWEALADTAAIALLIGVSYLAYLAVVAEPSVPHSVRTAVWLWLWLCIFTGGMQIVVVCFTLIALLVAVLSGGFRECVRPIRSHNGV